MKIIAYLEISRHNFMGQTSTLKIKIKKKLKGDLM